MTRSKKATASKASDTKGNEAESQAAPVVEKAPEAAQPTPESGAGETKGAEGPNPVSLAADQASEVAQSVAGRSGDDSKAAEAPNVPGTDLEGLSAALTSDAKPSPPAETRAEAVGSLAVALQPRDEEDLIVVVIGPKGGFWRAGRHFTPEPTRILASELSDEEAAMLRHEPKLAISLMKADVAE